MSGLDDQLLAIVVSIDESEMEKKREQLIVEQSKNDKALLDIENKILMLLSHSKGNILDDEVLIKTLQSSKEQSKIIEKKINESKKIEKKINEVRSEYM